MRIAMFYHSLLSDWNHGNAHFLRGVATELQARGHAVAVFEPEDSWSLKNLVRRHGHAPLRQFREVYPGLASVRYKDFDPDRMLRRADLVIVHEWNDPGLVQAIGEHRRTRGGYALLFHDTHHRSETAPQAIELCDFSAFDGVLAFGEIVKKKYLEKHWARRAWTWHEAADTRVFRPVISARKDGDLVWIGNWGDEERTEELHEFLLRPVLDLRLRARAYGVRYPPEAVKLFQQAGIAYQGWLPNFRVPEVFGRFSVTVHIPRRPYVKALPGIPTIRPFEAMACGIPLVCAPWNDCEGLFEPGRDFLVARDGKEMTQCLRALLADPDLAAAMARRARQTILRRHTCVHRVDALIAICRELGLDTDAVRVMSTSAGSL